MFRSKQTRVLLLNDMERLERTLFRLEQGRSNCYNSFLIISCALHMQCHKHLCYDVYLILLYIFIFIFNAGVYASFILPLLLFLLYYSLQLNTLDPWMSFGQIYVLLVVHEHRISHSKSCPLYIAEECAGVLSHFLWCL